PRVDVRDLDAPGAAVEGAGDGRGVVALDADDGGDVGQLGRPHHVLDGVPARRAVLAVDEDHVVPRAAEELDQPGGGVGRVDDADRTAGGQLPLGGVRPHAWLLSGGRGSPDPTPRPPFTVAPGGASTRWTPPGRPGPAGCTRPRSAGRRPARTAGPRRPRGRPRSSGSGWGQARRPRSPGRPSSRPTARR